MFTSAAPYDPIFWPIHPTSERLFHFRRTLSYLGVRGLSEVWAYEHTSVAATDTGTYCNWTGVDPRSTDMPSCSRTGGATPLEEVCPSHRAAAPLGGYSCVGVCGFEDLKEQRQSEHDGGGRTQEGGEFFTNEEFYDYVSPFNGDLPYMYDSFLWPHCDADGYPISA